MKRLLILILIAGAGYLGYSYYVSNGLPQMSQSFSTKSITAAPPIDTASVMNVLGATTTSVYQRATNALNKATAGKAEPVINKVVNDLQDRIKNLPAEEYKRVKYEFCRDVMPSPVGEDK